jgi:multicomponent Na+:H+ antiporter subunit D
VKVEALRTAGVVHLEAIALLFVAVFGLKAAAAPFHFWLPDVHPSAPTPVSALLSGILIKVGAYGLLRLTTLLFPGFQAVSEIVLILGLGTVLVGAVLATGQQDVKRLLAYSSVSQMGFILIAVGLGGARGIAAALFFLINHAIIKSMLFLAAGWAMQLTHERSLNRMGGLQGASPGLAAAFLVGAMALAGLPPTNGFVSKVLVFQVLLDSGRAIYLAVGMFGAVLGIVYAFRAWIKLFWGDRKGPTDAPPPQVAIRAPVAILAALCVVLGIASAPLVDLVTLIGVELADPSIYVDAVLGGSGP